jgi:hypothetical protein
LYCINNIEFGEHFQRSVFQIYAFCDTSDIWTVRWIYSFIAYRQSLFIIYCKINPQNKPFIQLHIGNWRDKYDSPMWIINVSENRRRYREWTIHKHWQHTSKALYCINNIEFGEHFQRSVFQIYLQHEQNMCSKALYLCNKQMKVGLYI